MPLKTLLRSTFLLLAFSSSAFATTREECVVFVKEAVGHIEAVGLPKALVNFNNPASQWHKGELYIFAYRFDGTNIALGSNPRIVGKNLLDLKTADGKSLIKDMIELIKEKNEAWYSYTWPHPETKKVEKKIAYFVRIPNEEAFVGSGIYLDQ